MCEVDDSTQRISDESSFRGSIKKRHNNIRLKNKNKKKQEENKQGTKSSTDDEASSTTRYETAHIPWPHRATEHNTEHLIVVGSWLLDFFFFFPCVYPEVSVPSKRKTTIIQVNQEAVFFLVIPSVRIQTLPEHLTRTWTIERPWKEDFYFSLYKNPNPPSSSTWGLGPSNSF